jgi:hypothetical protein
MAHLRGNDNDSVERDTDNSPQSEDETEALQSADVDDSEADSSGDADVKVLPGTGGPDDFGDVTVSDDELNL